MIPDGDLLRARVVTDLADPLEDALDRRLDGYAVLSARETLLANDDDRGVIIFEDGGPALAYHAGTDRGGPPALADIGAGPHRLELYSLDSAHLTVPHTTDELRVPPGMPAERLAGDPDPAGDDGAVVAFLEDEAAVEDIRETARAEAESRAEEWGFEDALRD
ncbi:hypothetical protein BRC63_01775 [Halobacteriales archaeon QH_10_70_21]|nr:MAG: hypothetical protein BRC63_01775 [Halobacteriales archaeon QH_10_70_21]